MSRFVRILAILALCAVLFLVAGTLHAGNGVAYGQGLHQDHIQQKQQGNIQQTTQPRQAQQTTQPQQAHQTTQPRQAQQTTQPQQAQQTTNAGQQKIGLVLSGGGAKGLSHIGVIQALEENNIPIDYICGTSMGAIVAGLYSIGYTPEEMIRLFSDKKFDAWFRGEPEYEYCSFFYRYDPVSSFVSLGFGSKPNKHISTDKNGQVSSRNKIKADLPVSMVKPYPMDIEFMRILSPASKAAKYNFDSLMVPFFCVSSDIANKREYISKSGDLGAAVRASMTYPFFFKPITIDSTLLFDGGFYNNFPWEIMEDSYSPDFIIGAKCVEGKNVLDEDDIVAQVTGMLVVQTDYNIPPDKGIIISRNYPYGVMDFKKVKEIVEMGYQNAQPYIKTIKERVSAQRTPQELDSMRLAFKSRCKPMMFDPNIEIVSGENVNKADKQFIVKTLKNKKKGVIDFETFKRGYYRVIATNTVKTFYPSYEFTEDSLYKLKMKVTKTAPFKVLIGGNISSSSLNQGFIGATYNNMGEHPWKASAGINLGRFYKGYYVGWKQYIGVKPLTYFSADFVNHQFDYYEGNQKLFTPDKFPNNVQERETFLEASLGTALSIRRNVVARFSLGAGRLEYRYFFDDNYGAKDKPNKTTIDILYSQLNIEKNSHNYYHYPTTGTRQYFGARYIFGSESYTQEQKIDNGSHNIGDIASGGTLHPLERFKNKQRHTVLGRVYMDNYFTISKWFNLGYLVDLTISTRQDKGNYYSTLMYMPAFQPVPHSQTLLLERYRANRYLGAAISPVIMFSTSLYLHTTFAYFQPWKQIRHLGGGAYEYTDRLPTGGMIGNAALVWQGPVGPISLATTYYSHSDRNHWYTQLNLGMLIFKKRIFR